MKKLHLNKINPGNYSKDKIIYERLKFFNNGIIEINSSQITVKLKDGTYFKSTIRKIEEDFMTVTYQGAYEDGTSFRLVQPAGVAKQLNDLEGKNETLTFGGMTGDGYAVHFELKEPTEPDNNNFTENQNTTFISATESKAEILLISADSLKEINPKMAIEHITRFMNLVEQNQIEILKFQHIQNIVYGYVIAINLSIISEDIANKKLSNLKVRFESSDHLRYENGNHIAGPHGGAKRGIEITPNFKLNEGYLVTIFNLEGNHPLWGDNIQMSTKQMKIIERTTNEIQLRGFGSDFLGNSFSNYGLTIHLKNNDIEFVKLHMYDRNSEIKYLN